MTQFDVTNAFNNQREIRAIPMMKNEKALCVMQQMEMLSKIVNWRVNQHCIDDLSAIQPGPGKEEKRIHHHLAYHWLVFSRSSLIKHQQA